jgi:hypothetical protein
MKFPKRPPMAGKETGNETHLRKKEGVESVEGYEHLFKPRTHTDTET